MPLVANDLKDTIIFKFKNIFTEGSPDYIENATANEYLIKLGNIVSEYVVNNADIFFSWTANLPPPVGTPDPVTTTKGKILNLIFTLSPPSNSSDRVTGLLDIQTKFITGLTAATYNITEAGFVTSPAIMSSSPSLSSLHLDITGNNANESILNFCTEIINWIKLQIPTSPCYGTHLAYMGLGQVTSIS